MKLYTKSNGSVLVISVDETRIDAAVAIQFKDRVRELCAGSEHRVILDLSKVDFIDSSGLGAVVASMKHLSDGRRMELACLSTNVSKVFRLTRMDTVFHIHERMTDLSGGFSCASPA